MCDCMEGDFEEMDLELEQPELQKVLVSVKAQRKK